MSCTTFASPASRHDSRKLARPAERPCIGARTPLASRTDRALRPYRVPCASATKPPRASHVAAATVPPRRVTRRISCTASSACGTNCKRQHRQSVVVCAVGKRQRACVADLETSSRGSRLRRIGVFDVDRGEIETLHAFDLAIFARQKLRLPVPQPTSSTRRPPFDTGEGDEERRKPAAPSPHLPFVAVTISGDECRRDHACRRVVTGGVSPAAFTSAALSPISFATYVSNSPALIVIGSTPSAASLSLTLGSCSALSISRFSFSTMSRGVFAGERRRARTGTQRW